MKKISQKTEKDIKRVINFTRENNGFISYLDFVVILSVHKLNLDNVLTYLTQMLQLGTSKIETSINREENQRKDDKHNG